mmetsp:Transcript_60212/g.106609  ORF Transcript_60212/g.106609 Transcript_60212/m.106609 type:complete len:283 (-) Transcript_60212:19-867(-)
MYASHAVRHVSKPRRCKPSDDIHAHYATMRLHATLHYHSRAPTRDYSRPTMASVAPRLVKQVDGEDRRFRDGLLQREQGDGEHRDAAIRDLGASHALRIRAKRVEAEHAGQVVVLLAVLLVESLALPIHSQRDDGGPVHPIHIPQSTVEQGRCTAVLREQVAEIGDLRGRPAEGGEHGEARVLHLGLAVPRELVRRVRQLQRVEGHVARKRLVADTHRLDLGERRRRRRLLEHDVHAHLGRHARRVEADGGERGGGGGGGGDHCHECASAGCDVGKRTFVES